MSAKQYLFELLDELPDRREFTGDYLQAMVRAGVHERHYPSTYLRYMREYRACHDCRIPCVSKKQSRYQMQRSVS